MGRGDVAARPIVSDPRILQGSTATVKRIDRLVQELAENEMAQNDAILRGDAKTGNKHAKRRIRAVKALQALGDEGRDALIPLMYEGRPDVRVVAAAYLLRYRHDDARRVLEELARGQGLAAFGAQECLKRWEEGAWQLDPG
jgi:hypothetical protein